MFRSVLAAVMIVGAVSGTALAASPAPAPMKHTAADTTAAPKAHHHRHHVATRHAAPGKTTTHARQHRAGTRDQTNAYTAGTASHTG